VRKDGPPNLQILIGAFVYVKFKNTWPRFHLKDFFQEKMYCEVEKGIVLYFLTYQLAMAKQLDPMAAPATGQPVVADLSRHDGDLQPKEDELSEGWSELSSV